MQNFETLNKLIEKTRIQLKTEFFGIDEQIDAIIENIKPWLCFPEILTRPTVINLWGMTGCGKTSLITRLIHLLNIEERLVYFNFAQIEEKSNWQIENMLQEHITEMDIDAPIFVYDEFQYARTITERGDEISKPALKVFWELLDSGKYKNEIDYYDKLRIKTLFEAFNKIITNDDIKIKHGIIVEGETLYQNIIKCRIISSTSWGEDEDIIEEGPTLFTRSDKHIIFKILKNNFPKDYVSIDNVYTEIAQMDKKAIYQFICKVHTLMLKNITLNFSKALIFVSGNLDEAYKMVYNSNPDMSPDQFHEKSKKISIVNIKNALQARFRVEQIARLGNIHLIYPSFSSNTFKQIIAKDIEEYILSIKDLVPIDLKIDSSVYEIIYKDAVFPTHGARPLFTSIYEIIKTKLTVALMYALENKIDYDTLYYEYKDNLFHIGFLKDGEKMVSLSLEQKLRVEHLRTSKVDDRQTITAVHEAGHAVVSIVLNKAIPNKLCSTSSDDSMLGFMLDEDSENENSRINTINEISVCLAGKAAETSIFKDDLLITNGCSADFNRATNLASFHIRRCGFGNSLSNSGWMPDAHARDNKIQNISNDIEIEKLMQQCWEDALQILEDQKVLLLRMAEHLSVYPVLEKEAIKDFVDRYYKGEFIEKNTQLYRNLLQENLKSLNSDLNAK